MRIHRSRYPKLCALALLAFFALAATAQAHNLSATTACASASGNTVTINWTAFANPPGTGNGGENTPTWKIVYTPTTGSPVTLTGSVTFPLDHDSVTVSVPAAPASIVASSTWTASQTTDGNANSISIPLTVGSCFASPAIATTASAGVAAGGTITDSAALSGGRAPTGTITFHLYAASDTTCSTPLSTTTTTVNGNGTYSSPPVTESTAGSYQWTASYGGDAQNTSVAEGCGQPAEQVVVTPPTTPPPGPNPPGPTPPSPNGKASPSIVTTASKGVAVGGKFSDNAVLSGGIAPTGTITFHLYAATDKTCSKSLATGTATVHGNGTYPSPTVTASKAGIFQWTATYSGDASNSPVSDSCNQAAEQVSISIVPLPKCTAHPKLSGVFGTAGRKITARLSSLGVQSVTFYLDGHKLATVKKAHGGFFTLTIKTSGLSYGRHFLTAKTKMKQTICKPVSLSKSFIHFNPSPPPPSPTG
ncbi:MAG TPA: hypothetical protein VG186_07565 [Solirubrobacteraceae bacterium]|jgi:hypothetical protein|nr:hypothetical protein [Solirubrobacteraceae bacterium]